MEENVNALQETIKSQKDLDILFRIHHKKSGKVRYLRGKGKAETDDQGETIAVFGTNWDVTDEMRLAEERKKALDKLKATQSQLIQSEKMASLGILTAGVAHELNNPLNYIVGAHTAIKEHLEEYQSPNKAELKEYLDWIKSGTDRATRIIKGLNLFSRSNEDFDEACDLKKIVQDCLLMLQSKHKNRININLHFDAEDMLVIGNYGKLHQAVLNILSNAMDAIEQKGEINIYSKIRGKLLCLEFKDDGSGISKGDLKKVMDPFFTTKPPGVGTGLGLYITHTIIERHKGSIQLTSKKNEGTKVTLKLPKLS